MAKTVVPPPVILDDEWEHQWIESQVAKPQSNPNAPMSGAGTERHAKGPWHRQRAYRAGSLRIYTLSGLQASTTSRIGRAGLGYGESKVEIEYARIRDKVTGNVLSWEEACRDDGLWSKALEYRVPVSVAATACPSFLLTYWQTCCRRRLQLPPYYLTKRSI